MTAELAWPLPMGHPSIGQGIGSSGAVGTSENCVRHRRTSAGPRLLLPRGANPSAPTVRAVLLVVLGVALLLMGEGAQAADRILPPERRSRS